MRLQSLLIKYTGLFLFSLFLFSGCTPSDSDKSAPKGNAVYYWRTSFSLSEPEQKFLKENSITTIYVKFFDIVASASGLRPESTLIFKQPFPKDIEIVPTVFIDSKSLSAENAPENLADLIVSRVDTMMSKNGYPLAPELQIDFDWAQSNRTTYFSLLQQIANILHSHGRTLSTTIRLHQLSQTPPPADYGTLMLYNTGNFSSPVERNSILSTKAIKPYLKYLKGYSLPLATALPIYSWDLLFRHDHFVVIARGLNHQDTTQFAPVTHNLYRARKYGALPGSANENGTGARILPGDILRHEEVSYELLDSVASIIKEIRPGALQRVILYHLDQKSLSNYNSNDIKEIYNYR